MLLNRIITSFLFSILFSTYSFAFYTQHGIIYDKNAKEVKIDGISWSGFQDSKIFQGLSSNPFYTMSDLPSSYSKTYGMLDALVHPWDFADSGVTKSNGVNFKTVRVPIQPGLLYDTGGTIDLNKSISNKSNPEKGNGIFCKTWETSGSACAATVSPKEAFWISLQEFKKNNVKVLIDFHHRYGYGDGYRDGTVYELKQYETDLKLLLDEIKARSLTNVIGVDIFNEPYRLYWFKDNDGQPAWINVIATAAKVIKENNPDILLFVEGPGQGSGDPSQPVICINDNELVADPEAYSISNDSGNCQAKTKRVEFKGNWGEDFKALLDKNKAKNSEPSFDKTTFVQQLKIAGLNDSTVTWLMGDESANNSHLVFSPHVYPREVATWESSPGKPSELRFDWTWGFLAKAGYPVVLGEASWKTAEGLAFFENSLTPYLEKNGMKNNVFFWAVGYLGDTVSMIDPNTGKLDLEAQSVLHSLYSQTTNTGKLNVTFSDPGISLISTANLIIKETNQSYNCSYAGCSLNLEAGTYGLSVTDSYHVNNNDHKTYLVRSKSTPIPFNIQNGKTSDLNVFLELEQAGIQPALSLDYKVNLLDSVGNAVGNQAAGASIKFTSESNPEATSNCAIEQGHCSITLYNQKINNTTGTYDNDAHKIELPKFIKDNGVQYNLVTAKSDTGIILTADSTDRQLNAYYQEGVSSINQGCEVKLLMDSYSEGSAVFQGNLSNTSEKPIKRFSFKISFNDSEMTNTDIVNQWIGNLSNLQETAGIYTLNAQAYDNYSGILPGHDQTIGFQVNANVLKMPSVNVLSCEVTE